jgi:hypothetical protein
MPVNAGVTDIQQLPAHATVCMDPTKLQHRWEALESPHHHRSLFACLTTPTHLIPLPSLLPDPCRRSKPCQA